MPTIRPVSPSTFAVDVGAELVLVVTVVDDELLATWCLGGVPLCEAEVGEA